ncbi:hypothetical protein BGZ63DRAFT_368564, partial [Mariannaea sp. PMI_226]
GPVRFDLIAVSIETKIAIGAIEEARIRLGLCVAAWHKRVSALSHSARSRYIISLPLILIIKHDWHLLLVVDRGDKIEIVEGIAIGDTRGLIGLYKIVGVLRVLALWVQGEYMTWIQRLLNRISATDA